MSSYSVFLPVRNGWPYVVDCVESVLAQTHNDIELHVLDNHSTDQTSTWLRSIRDPRVHVLWSAVDLSIEESWSRIVSVAKREYMTVIGHDDLLDRDFFAAIDKLIGRFPTAGLYQTGARYINSMGRTIRSCRPVPDRETAGEYLKARFEFRRDIFGTGYVMRSSDFDRVGGMPPFERLLFSDDALWLTLIRNSFKMADARELCSVRIHEKSASASTPALWRDLLKGLGQLDGFLREEGRINTEVREILNRYGPAFMLEYHRNIYIYALLRACEKRSPLKTALAPVAASLERLAPSVATSLRNSLKVRAIELLMGAGMQRLILWLWRHYTEFRSRKWSGAIGA